MVLSRYFRASCPPSFSNNSVLPIAGSTESLEQVVGARCHCWAWAADHRHAAFSDSRGDQTKLHSDGNRLLSIRGTKFGSYRVEMELHRALTDLELVGNVIGVESVRNHPQNALLSPGQRGAFEP